MIFILSCELNLFSIRIFEQNVNINEWLACSAQALLFGRTIAFCANSWKLLKQSATFHLYFNSTIIMTGLSKICIKPVGGWLHVFLSYYFQGKLILYLLRNKVKNYIILLIFGLKISLLLVLVPNNILHPLIVI